MAGRIGRLRRLLGRDEPFTGDAPVAPIEIEPIGFVRSQARDPRRVTMGLAATLMIGAAYAEALDGLAGFSHAIVVTWLHQVADEHRAILREHPGGDRSLPAIGVLALRTHNRPNPIGVHIVEIERVEPPRVEVRGLDAIDGTPVLDIKPYIPLYDSVADARLPGWATGEPE